MNKVKLAAHRGYSAAYPENTILAFKKALTLDIDMLEIDLHMTKDGEIIMMHDHAVDRTSDGTGLVKDKTLKEMRALDVGKWKGEQFAGERVPLFTEFLDMMRDYKDIEVNVELKDYIYTRGEKEAYESCDRSLALLDEYKMNDRIYINSWSGAMLEYIAKKYDGKYRLHGYYPKNLMRETYDEKTIYDKLFCACLFEYETVDGKSVNTDRPMAKEHFDNVLNAGVEAWVYYKEETLEKMKAAYERGATGVTSNDPVLSGRLLDEIGARKLKK